MVARGEFAFLVAYSARSLTSADGVTPMMSNDVYAMVRGLTNALLTLR